MGMKEYIISTQDEYDRALARDDLLQKSPFYDIARDRGTEIVEEVNSLMRQYLYHDGDKGKVYDALSWRYFDRSQADEIIKYFKENLPGDMSDIECGLNHLRIMPPFYATYRPDMPKLIIEDSREKIVVRSDAEVRGNSFVEAFENAFITAKNNAHIIAHDGVSVEACHKTRIDAHDRSQIRAFNNVLVTASGESRIGAYHKSCVMAGEKSKVFAYHDAYIKSIHEADITASGKTVVDARGNSTVTAFNTSHIIAWDTARVSANDQSFIHAWDRSKIEARNQSCVVARKNALVAGFDDSLVLTGDKARSITSGNSFSIDGKHNTAGNLRENILTVMRRPRFAKDPILALQILIQAASEENRPEINKKLRSLGCYGEAATKNILSRWVKSPGEDISYER
jgi:hypothetical protein